MVNPHKTISGKRDYNGFRREQLNGWSIGRSVVAANGG